MEDTIKCSRCEQVMVKVDGVYALTKVENSDQGLTFFPASGIPVVVYICPKCGKVEMFSAKIKGAI